MTDKKTLETLAGCLCESEKWVFHGDWLRDYIARMWPEKKPENPLPCANCGTDRAIIRSHMGSSTTPDAHDVYCPVCNASVVNHLSLERAVRVWNNTQRYILETKSEKKPEGCRESVSCFTCEEAKPASDTPLGFHCATGAYCEAYSKWRPKTENTKLPPGYRLQVNGKTFRLIDPRGRVYTNGHQYACVQYAIRAAAEEAKWKDVEA